MLHHSATGWSAAPDLASVFEPEAREAAGMLLPAFRFVVDDVSRIPAEQLVSRTGHALTRLCLLALQSAQSWDKLVQAVPSIGRVAYTLADTPEHHQALFRLFTYILQVAPQGVDVADLK